jgi:hypothetical protein
VNKLVVILFVFSFFSPVHAQYDFEAKEKDRMAKAKVKTQTEWTYEYVDGKPSAEGYKSSVRKYNTKGNVTETVNYNKEGKVISVIVYQYDNKENRVNLERFQGNKEKLLYSQKIVYDTKGNKTREYGFDGATTYNNTYQYNSEGKLTNILYTLDNAPVEKRELSHSGNKTKIQIFGAGNVSTYVQVNTYNDNGLLVEEVKTSVGSGKVIHTLGFTYNSYGDLSEEVRKREGDVLDYKKTYAYNSANQPIKEETISVDGTSYISHEYKYNNSGDLIFESWKKNNRSKEASTKKITYDTKGIYAEMEYYYASYALYSLYKYEYEFY